MFLDFIFYKLHRFFLRAQGIDYAAWCAMVSVSCVMAYNLLTLIILMQVLKIIPIIELDLCWTTSFGVVLFLIGYFYWLHKKRYVSIYNKYKNENKKHKFLGAVFIWLYLVLSFVLFVYISILRYDFIHSP